MLSQEEVLTQSRNAFQQWEKVWLENAKANGVLYKEKGVSHKDMRHRGAGKSLLCIATGPSTEDTIGELRNVPRDAVDVACVDKSFGYLVDHGIVPDYVIVEDAMIDYEKWCAPWIEHSDKIMLLSNVTANTKWTMNWKGPICFHVNKDNIKTQDIYGPASGCPDQVPAGSNVGNALLIFTTFILGYDEYWLVGYDFCWGVDDNYYTGGDSVKRYWMRHIEMIDKVGRWVYTSQNLMFSARWLSDFYVGVLVPKGFRVFNCGGKGILEPVPMVPLKRKFANAKRRAVAPDELEKRYAEKVYQKVVDAKGGEKELFDSIRELNVINVVINYLKPEDAKCLELARAKT